MTMIKSFSQYFKIWFLWFDNQAEDAANFYVSIFKNSKVNKINYYGEAGPGPKGSVMTVFFELDDQGFVALNGGTPSKFTESISFVVNCNTQQEVDEYWEKLSAKRRTKDTVWLVEG